MFIPPARYAQGALAGPFCRRVTAMFCGAGNGSPGKCVRGRCPQAERRRRPAHTDTVLLNLRWQAGSPALQISRSGRSRTLPKICRRVTAMLCGAGNGSPGKCVRGTLPASRTSPSPGSYRHGPAEPPMAGRKPCATDIAVRLKPDTTKICRRVTAMLCGAGNGSPGKCVMVRCPQAERRRRPAHTDTVLLNLRWQAGSPALQISRSG